MVSWVGIFFLGSAVVSGGRVSGGVRVFCAPRICGRNQEDQNGAYGVSKRVCAVWGRSRCYEITTKHINTACVQKVQLLTVKRFGASRNQ